MRCYIKEYIYTGIYNKLYQGEVWEFTGRIQYQRDETGDMVVCFEVTMLENEDEKENESKWYSTFWFGFDESSEAVIYDCNNNGYQQWNIC